MAMPPQQRPNDGQIGGNGPGQNGGMSQQNLNGIVRQTVFISISQYMHKLAVIL